jgi:hypothetical protein
MRSNLFDRQPEDVLATALAESEGETYVVSPTEQIIEDLIEVAGDLDEAPTLRLLADGRTVRKVMEDFIIASSAADLIDRGVLEIKTTETDAGNTVLVTEQSVMAVVTAGGHVAGLTTADGEFVDDAFVTYADQWDDAEDFQLRTPPISQVRESLSEDMGNDSQKDFSEVLSSLETARGDGDGLDEVTISLLVAAKNEELFYDVSKWGEDVGVASKATFSRVKNQLEDTGLIRTEKVPVDVGRPRQRLTIQDDRLQNASGSQLASVAQSILN